MNYLVAITILMGVLMVVHEISLIVAVKRAIQLSSEWALEYPGICELLSYLLPTIAWWQAFAPRYYVIAHLWACGIRPYCDMCKQAHGTPPYLLPFKSHNAMRRLVRIMAQLDYHWTG